MCKKITAKSSKRFLACCIPITCGLNIGILVITILGMIILSSSIPFLQTIRNMSLAPILDIKIISGRDCEASLSQQILT